jgi:hypothetical protein
MQNMTQWWAPGHAETVLEVVAYAEIWPGIDGGSKLATLPITAGQVQIDDTNAVRRQCSGVQMVLDPALSSLGPLVPQEASDYLFPDGNEIVLYKGLKYPSRPFYANAPTISLPWVNGGQPFAGEVARLGTFLIEEVDIAESKGALTITVAQGLDRAETIDRGQMTQPYSTSGSPLWQEVQNLIALSAPGLFLNSGSLSLPTQIPPPTTWQIGTGPFTAAMQLAQAAACEVFLDVDGSPFLQPVPDPKTLPVVAEYAEGEDCIFNEVSRKLVNAGVPNWIIVIAQGSNIATPLRSDPTTIQVIQTSIANQQTQVDAMATAAGYAMTGMLEQATIGIRDNPAHDAGDVVAITRARAGLNDELFLVDQATIDLGVKTTTKLTGRKVGVAT